MCWILSKSAKKLWRDLTIFQNSLRPPSWICLTHIWTTHKEYLLVFIVVHNLVGIDAVISILWKFISHVWLKNAYSRPKVGFGGYDPLNAVQYQQNPQKTHHWVKRRHITQTIKIGRSTSATCWRDEEIKKERQSRKPDKWRTGYSPRPPTSSDRNTICHGGRSSGGRLKFSSFTKIGSVVSALCGVENCPIRMKLVGKLVTALLNCKMLQRLSMTCACRWLPLCYFAPSSGTKYCDQCVCLSVCLSVCLCPSARISQNPHVRTFRNFLHMLLQRRLGPFVAIMQRVFYWGFPGWRRVFT